MRNRESMQNSMDRGRKENRGKAMEKSEIYSHVDHTLLKAYASWDEIRALCDEAVQYHTASVCIPPSYIRRIREAYGNSLRICTVIGFPLGYSTAEIKVSETQKAVRDGADEVDVVINLGDVKNGEYGLVLSELKAVREAAGEKIMKVIIETCYLNDEEKRTLCHVVTEAGADYIKTSTGFGTGGAALQDIRLFQEEIGPQVKIKAAGGMHSRQDFVDFLKAGCQRLGTSSAVKVLEND